MSDCRFVLDQMLGRLAKWLRLLGYDSVYFDSVSDLKLIKIAREENRILLTRNTKLVKRRAIKNHQVKAILIQHDILDDQLQQLSRRLNLAKEGMLPPFCAECNSPIKTVRKEEVQRHVPNYVYQTQMEFAKCPSCGRYYWPGTHWERIQEKLLKIF